MSTDLFSGSGEFAADIWAFIIAAFESSVDT